MIKIVLLGAGNVATHLYKVFKTASNIEVVQWYNRNKKAIESYKNEVEITDDVNNLIEADVYIIAISDDAIEALSASLPFENRLVVHTSGSARLYDIDQKHYRGVFYPLQTFSKAVDLDFTTVPICIETLRKQDFKLLETIGKSLGCTTYKVNPKQRPALHLAAVFINNFTNQIYRVAHEITEKQGADFDILKPLITETARKVQEVSPYLAQTGPAKRNDKKTIKRHLKLLDNPHHEAIYNLLTESIKKTHGQ
ncbi:MULTISPECIES: Rossmann-like and DUF2520 domain-containing protein [unclassified Olleya]|uniref:Rossmann-like and DUF2520 domain-containing protein n=1 Tax=unclassified Olleya TaxID=2615019 RepID=UPI000C30A08B|nr:MULTISPECIES: DUF2520 domain-containing protein [unclassified Olleya]AUC77110.1 DUF2520 domain-containing protein [Olleya sp. Bg11-27]QXP59501.1 DUF2520 domain-containing protein [Olleya sp. HaHaR_3_96]